MLAALRFQRISRYGSLFINSCFAHGQSELQETWFAPKSPRVHNKVLDLSFNDFKGPRFEPLENCKALQQLYLAGKQITSLVSLPQRPNLEFLSVAQNRLKSLSMGSQPRLQVLAASKNKISTLQGFPHLPALENLRVEENPILKMPHLEAASILLVGPY